MKITPFAFPSTSRENGVSSVTCMVDMMSNELEFEWLKNGVKLNSDPPKLKISTEIPTSTLIITQINGDDNGNYTCIAKSSHLQDSFTAELLIPSKPRWLVEPHQAILREGTQSSIDCVAQGAPRPQISWTVDNDEGEHHSCTQTVIWFNVLQFQERLPLSADCRLKCWETIRSWLVRVHLILLIAVSCSSARPRTASALLRKASSWPFRVIQCALT